MKLERGAVVRVVLDPTVGHEQRGVRPAVLVSDPAVIDDQRFPLVCAVPITRIHGEGALYPQLGPGSSGLRRTSFARIDQPRSVDKRRVRPICGKLSAQELFAVDEGLQLYLGLG